MEERDGRYKKPREGSFTLSCNCVFFHQMKSVAMGQWEDHHAGSHIECPEFDDTFHIVGVKGTENGHFVTYAFYVSMFVIVVLDIGVGHSSGLPVV